MTLFMDTNEPTGMVRAVRKLGKFEVLGRWMGRRGSWLHGMADQLFVGDHTVMDCCKIKWDEAKGTHVQHSKEDPIDVTGDADWFDGENSLPVEAKIEGRGNGDEDGGRRRGMEQRGGRR